jgi:hypothetical protein
MLSLGKRKVRKEKRDSMEKGFFRSKKGFTVVQNEITKDSTISLKAKGLYLVIQAYITMPDKKWTKDDFLNLTKEGRKAFDGAWKELKDTGYLKVHIMAVGGRWHTEYELLDKPVQGPHTLYHNKDGKITSDNIRRAEKKKAKEEKTQEEHYPQKGSNGAENNHYPPNGSNEAKNDHYPQKGSNGVENEHYPLFGSNGNDSNGNGGNNHKTLYIKPDNNTCISNPNQSQEEGTQQYPMEYLRERYDADDLILMGVSEEDVEMVMDILHDAVNTTKKTIRVNREEKPTEVVRSRLLKLRCMDILYAIAQYHKQTTQIHHQKAYMLSILYDARGQGHLDYANQVNHDFYARDGSETKGGLDCVECCINVRDS